MANELRIQLLSGYNSDPIQWSPVQWTILYDLNPSRFSKLIYQIFEENDEFSNT
mgnify:CR=1 FL=1